MEITDAGSTKGHDVCPQITLITPLMRYKLLSTRFISFVLYDRKANMIEK